MNEEKSDAKCDVCTDDVICKSCLEKMKEAGIPEHTIKWMQLSKLDRIRTVMF